MEVSVCDRQDEHFVAWQDCCRKGRPVPAASLDKATGFPKTKFAKCCYCGSRMVVRKVDDRWFYMHP